MKKYTIYKITNLIDNRIYIGKHETYNLDDNYLGSGIQLSYAKQKYGIQNFKKEILYIFDTEEEMNAKESELVTEQFCSRNDTYNICPGGKGGWGYVNQTKLNLYGKNGTAGYGLENLLDGSRLKQKLLNDGRFEDWKQNISTSLKNKYGKYGHHWQGLKHKEETKRKIGEKNAISQLGNRNSQFGSMWITNGISNKKIKKIDFIPEGWYKGRVLTNT